MDDGDLETVPLDTTLVELVTFHGRDFQRYALENGIYYGPVDEHEADRHRFMHEVFNRMFDNRLIFPPLPAPRRILDCGFGSASWAIDVAEQFPTCEVTGIDIYPNMAPEDLPPNLDLQVDDLNSPFTFGSNHFDLVHSRLMAGGINADRWGTYMADILRVLRPGGWCQMVEIYYNAQSDNGTLTDNHALRVWSRTYLQSLQPYKNPRAAMQLQNLMTQAGFVEVEGRLLTLPLNPRDREMGAANRENVHRLLSSLAIYPFTEGLGMTPTDVQLLAAQARMEADNPSFKAYFPVYVCIGRKPGGSNHSKGSHQYHHKSGRTSDSRKRARH
ncbi:S-adenosyl-L-methionine-dependent methyltransferase [Coniochaeta ligniaria NRRL 30616]|uniref:S-adenosyl-L-methionine-dependent methyltransferase n=1 Tax=Coniochaeta ligniaria NRRL 30616 TaxID=1408157 RepID=A0A1J7IXL2_9PEZI|nr:S-adenosyl-L-methionine-dependent methyltransferase [Coniochaeta ligniaria NRRL 30616]